MRMKKIKINSDLTAGSLDTAVREFVEEFGCWPSAVVTGYESYHRNDGVVDAARSLGLEYYGTPAEIHLRPDAWAVVGHGRTIFSPGA